MDKKERLVPKGIWLPFILITSLFFLWGLANNMTDTLLAAFKRIMSMSDSRTALIQISCYGLGYFIFALPAAIYIKRFSYKSGILLGLGLYLIGCFLFFPAKYTANYFHFLGALWILFGGLSILETAANPYIIAMGHPSTATRRLNFAQSFNPIGSITGVFLSQIFILAYLDKAGAEERASMTSEQLKIIQNGELNAVTTTYVTIGAILLLLWIVIWSFTIRYAMKELNLEEVLAGSEKTAEQVAANYYLASLILFVSSRFICTALMKYIKPEKLLTILSTVAIVLCLAVVFVGGYPGVFALVGVSGCMSLMFPTIFGMSVKGLGEDTKIASSLQIMAIVGGAVITQLEGLVSTWVDHVRTVGGIKLPAGINMAYLVPLLCFVFITWYASRALRNSRYLD